MGRYSKLELAVMFKKIRIGRLIFGCNKLFARDIIDYFSLIGFMFIGFGALLISPFYLIWKLTFGRNPYLYYHKGDIQVLIDCEEKSAKNKAAAKEWADEYLK